MAHLSVRRYLAVSHVMTGLRHSRVPLAKKKLERTGATRMENKSAPSSANATVQAMGLNNRPSTRCSVKMGRYAVIMMAMAKNTGR